MASRLDTFRLVAQLLGQDEELIDPDETTRLARACRAVWDTARQATLRANDWNCCTARAQLAALEDAPPFGFAYAFNLPGDLLRLVDVTGPLENYRDWTLEGGQLLANYAPLQIIYVADVTDPERWDSKLAEAIATKMAAMIAVNVTGDVTVADQLQRQFDRLTIDAQAADATENPPQEFDEDPWLLSRIGYGQVWFGG